MMMTMVNMTVHPPPSTHAATSLHPLLLSFSLLLSLYLSPLFLLLLLPPLLLPLLLLFLLPPLFLALAKQKVKVKVRVLGPAREKKPQRAGKGKKRPERAGRCLRSLRAGCSPWKCPRSKADDKVVLGSEFELLVADDKVVQFLCAGTIAPILMRSFSQNGYGRV